MGDEKSQTEIADAKSTVKTGVEYTSDPKALTLKVYGPITEVFYPKKELEALAACRKPGAPALPVLIDTSAVTRMNSVGIAGWITFIAAVQAEHSIRFTVLSEQFVELAREVPQLLGNQPAVVEGFHVPYLCKSCGARFQLIAKATEIDDAGEWTGPRMPPCLVCKSRLTSIDAYEEEYFMILRRMVRSKAP